MEMFVIEGGRRLAGSVVASGNKNEALPVLAATLLTSDPVTLDNIPRIRDVLVMCEILGALGADVEWLGPNRVRVCTGPIGEGCLDEALCRRIRASILFAGPMLARMGSVELPPPGGDVIGRRRVDTHFQILGALGATVSLDGGYRVEAERLLGADIMLDEASVTATENGLMAAVLAEGTTVLRNAACEPHVCGLAQMLRRMGAEIQGIGSNTLTVHGVKRLHGTGHRIGADYLEIGSFIGLAAVTDSEISIEGVEAEHLRRIRMTFEKLGVRLEISGESLLVPGGQSRIIRRDMGDHICQIDDGPWPGFPTDLMSVAITVATQCSGTILFFEKMFEGRMFFVDQLQAMGASIIMCDPHRIVVVGPSVLRGSRIESPDIRAGISLLIAALCAQGETTMHHIQQIDRGYESIDQKLISLGAQIERRPIAR